MSKKYFIPVILMVGLGLVLVLLPPKKAYDEIQPEELLRQVTSSSRFISPDVVADRMINNDPSLLLVDVRNAGQYNDYTLPGSVNIPLKDILLPDHMDLLSEEGKEIIFFSNGDIIADQAWILTKRKGLQHIFVMKGGLNEWFDSFFLLQPPPESASNEDIALYQFRCGVRQYLTGAEIEIVPKQAPDKITVTPRAKKSSAEGGC